MPSIGVDVILEMMNRHYDTAFLKDNETALAMLQEAIPSIRVIALQYAESNYRDENDYELSDADLLEDDPVPILFCLGSFVIL